MTRAIDQFIKNPKMALFTISWPVIIGMLVQVMYNIVDTAFVGRLGPKPIAAVTFTFPIFFLMSALTFGLNTGTNSLISRLVGARQYKKAENAAMHSLMITIIFSIGFAILGMVFLKPLLIVSGAATDVLVLSTQFMNIILIGSPVYFLMYTFSSIFTAQGDTKTATKIQVISLIVNIILDPILIFYFRLGVRGAAFATIIGISVGLILSLYYLFSLPAILVRVKKSSFHLSKSIITDTLKVGIPAMLMQTLLSVYVILINKFMAHYGTDFVAAFGLGSRIESFATLPFFGLSVGMLTLSGIFYGAKKKKELRSFIWYSLKVISGLACLMGVIFFFVSNYIFLIFTNDVTLLKLAEQYLRIDVITFPLMAIGFGIARIVQGMDDGVAGFVITVTRVLIVFVPVAYLFTFVLGYSFLGIAWSMVIGGIVSNIVAVIYLRRKLRYL